MTVGRLLSMMAIVFVGLFAFQNCGQNKKAVAAFDPGTLLSASSTSLNGTYTITQWTCDQKDVLQRLVYSGATTIQIVIGTSSVTQKISFGTNCSSTEIYPLTYSGLTNLTLTQSSVTCDSSCESKQCQSVSQPTQPAKMTFTYARAVNGKSVELTHTLTSLDISNTGWPYGTTGCGVGSSVDLILSK